MVIPRLAHPDGKGGPISTLMMSGKLSKAGVIRMWHSVNNVVQCMEKILDEETVRIQKAVAGGGRRSYGSIPQHGGNPYSGGRRDSDRSRSPHRRPSPGAYDRLNANIVAGTAALKAFQALPKRDARAPPGPKGPSTAPHSKPFVRRDTSSRSPRRGPPSTTNTCNYCASPDHFWRTCPKREAEEKSNPKVHAAKLAVCKAMDAAEEVEQSERAAHLKQMLEMGAAEDEPGTEADTSGTDSRADSSGGDTSEYDD